MNARPTLFIAGFLVSCAWAQDEITPSGYQKLRKLHHIEGVARSKDLPYLQQTKVIELAGSVKGTFKVAEQQTLMLEPDGGGDTLMLEAHALPSWIANGETKIHALAEASRPPEGGTLRLKLLALIADSQLSGEAPKKAKLAKSTPSRGHYVRQKSGSKTPGGNVAPIYSNFIRKWNPRLSKQSADQIATCVIGFGLKRGVDPRLLMAVIMTESDFRPETTSHAGAMGLGQLMPVNLEELGLNNAYDTVQNLYGTATLIRRHIDKYRAQTSNEYDALVLALAGYNAGDGAVKKYGGVPPYRETQDYVRKVIRYYEMLIGYRISP